MACKVAAARRIIGALLDSLDPTVVYLWGPSGVGKSTLVRALADERGRTLTTLIVGQQALNALLADSVFVPGDGMRAVPPAWFELVQEGGILFLDELDKALMGPAAEIIRPWLLSLLREREVGGFPLPANVKVIAAGNTSPRDLFSEGDPLATRIWPLFVGWCGCEQCLPAPLARTLGEVLQNFAWVNTALQVLQAAMLCGLDVETALEGGRALWGDVRHEALLRAVKQHGAGSLLPRGRELYSLLQSGALSLERLMELFGTYPPCALTYLDQLPLWELVWKAPISVVTDGGAVSAAEFYTAASEGRDAPARGVQVGEGSGRYWPESAEPQSYFRAALRLCVDLAKYLEPLQAWLEVYKAHPTQGVPAAQWRQYALGEGHLAWREMPQDMGRTCETVRRFVNEELKFSPPRIGGVPQEASYTSCLLGIIGEKFYLLALSRGGEPTARAFGELWSAFVLNVVFAAPAWAPQDNTWVLLIGQGDVALPEARTLAREIIGAGEICPMMDVAGGPHV